MFSVVRRHVHVVFRTSVLLPITLACAGCGVGTGSAGMGNAGTGGVGTGDAALVAEGGAADEAAGGVGIASAGAESGAIFGVNAHHPGFLIGEKLDEAQIKFVRVDLGWAWFLTMDLNCQRSLPGKPGCDHIHAINSVYFDIPDGFRARGITILVNLAYRYDDNNPIPPEPEFSHCTQANSCVPRTNDPTNAAWRTFLEEWDAYVTAMVQDVGTMVPYFGIWNEPNATYPNGTKAFFAGYDWQYDELVTRACTILHANGSKCVAPSTAIYTDTEQNFQRDLSWHKARVQANRQLIDVADGHIYDYHANFAARAAAFAAGSDSIADIPFWVTETAPFVSDPVLDRPGFNLELQERELVQQLADLRTGISGIDGLFYYDLQSVEFGLVEALSITEYLSRPAFNALVQLSRGTYRVPPAGQCTDTRGAFCTAACLASGYECP